MADVLAAPQQSRADSPVRTLTLISIAHWISHFHLLVLPMLFPFLKEQLGVGYVELGFAMTVFAVVSGLTQAPTGYLVDHIGARKILIIGITLGGLSLIGLGLHVSYYTLIVCAVGLGLANSVYHPADYAILAAHMDETRMGRAFSIHTFAGYVGGAVAPAMIAAMVTTVGGRGALIGSGVLAVLIALMLIVGNVPDAGVKRSETGQRGPQPSMMTPALIMLTVFFMLLTLSTSGIGNFGVVALMNGYAQSFSTANLALTCFLGSSAVGVLAGGYLADRTRRHAQVAAACFVLNAAIILTIASAVLPSILIVPAMALGGFLGGVIAPSRDMMVRAAAPEGTAGRAFGIVSTGFNIGGIVSPVMFGFVMDQNAPHWVFGISGLFMLVTVALALVTDRRPGKAHS